MSIQVPGYLYPFILTGTAAAVAVLLAGLNRSLKLARWDEAERRTAVNTIATLLLTWAAVTLGLSILDFYGGGISRSPTIQYGLLIPIGAGILLYQRWGMLRRAIDAVPQSWIVGLQFYRALGVIFLILLAQDRLPGVFAWPAGVGDMLVGLLAPVAALSYSRRWTNASRWVRAWNWLGLADLASAVTIGFLSSPSPLQRLAFDLPNRLIGVFPLVLIPVYMVPLSILLHLASLKKLQQDARVHPAEQAALA